MLRVRKYITLSLGVSNQIIAEYFVLRKDLHGIKFTSADLPHKVHLTKRAASKQF